MACACLGRCVAGGVETIGFAVAIARILGLPQIAEYPRASFAGLKKALRRNKTRTRRDCGKIKALFTWLARLWLAAGRCETLGCVRRLWLGLGAWFPLKTTGLSAVGLTFIAVRLALIGWLSAV